MIENSESPMSRPIVSVVIGSYNRIDFLKLTLESVRRELETVTAEIFVVDGGSDDGSLEWLAAQKDIVTIVQHNRGTWKGKPVRRRSWGYFMNLGFKSAQGKYVCMLSDDCLVVPGAIRNGIARAEAALAEGQPLGAVAFYWRNWPEQQRYWVGLTLRGRMFVNHGLYLREALATVGYVDEKTYAFYHADGDLCLKMWQAGFECIDSPDSFVEHYSHANEVVRESNLVTQKRDWERYLHKWQVLAPGADVTSGQGWLYRDFSDAAATADRFKRLAAVRAKGSGGALRKRIGRLRSAFGKRGSRV